MSWNGEVRPAFRGRDQDDTYSNEEKHDFEGYEEEWKMYPAKTNYTAKKDDLDRYANSDEGEHDEAGLGVMLLLEIRYRGHRRGHLRGRGVKSGG